MTARKRPAQPENNRPDGIEPNGGVTRSVKAISALGVLAAMAVMILVNVVSARHYQRWDFTTAQLYTLSPATLTTLQGLESSVDVDVLLSPSDPLHRSVQNLLEVYRSKTDRIRVRFVDPDRHPAEFAAVQQKYDIVAGRSEDGKVVTDAAIVVASRERHWFILAEDLVDFSELDEGRSRSKLEQSLTTGIRSVLGNKKQKLCFTMGHGEYSLDDNSGQGLGELRDRLLKNNYDVDSVNPAIGVSAGLAIGQPLDHPSGQPSEFPAKALSGCDVLVVVGPSVPFSRAEADAISERMRAGMGGFFLLSPILDPDSRSQLATGLEPVARLFGIGIANDYVFELDNDARIPRGTGEIFFPTLEAHAITEGLAGLSMAVGNLRVVALRSRSLDVINDGVQPIPILKTSARAFGMTDFHAWARRGGDPTRGPGDREGPLSIGLAAELPSSSMTTSNLVEPDPLEPSPVEQNHGARLVVLGSANYALGQNWRDIALRGNAVLTANILSWISSYQPIVDVPAKITPAATLRITESSLNEIVRYVLIFMPGAALLLAIAMYMRRRSREDRPTQAPRAKQTGSVPPDQAQNTHTKDET